MSTRKPEYHPDRPAPREKRDEREDRDGDGERSIDIDELLKRAEYRAVEEDR